MPEPTEALARIAELEARLWDLYEHLDRLSDETTAVMVKVGVDNSPDPTSIDHQLRDHASRLDSIEDHLATAATDLVQRIRAAQGSLDDRPE